jgi:hypothetical protein
MMEWPEWNALEERQAMESLRLGNRELRPGDRVRLWPRGRADVMDIALEGRTATIEAIEQD